MNNVNVIVKKEFLDRYTGKNNKVGDKLTVTEARYREIMRSGVYVEVIKDTPKTEAKKEIK